MFIVAGLGNPKKTLEKTRHNAGFQALDVFAKKNIFSEFVLAKKYNALVSEGFLGTQKIIALKPQTFMNASGSAVKAIIKNFKLRPQDLIVVHDDADLPTGSLRISQNRGPGGHKGVSSIIQELKSPNFIRIRIGIAPFPLQEKKGKTDLKNFVLKNFTEEEEKKLEAVLKKSAEAIELIIQKGTEEAMNLYN
ncbi:MAG: aminoacyl-tRNA hydrolase [Candidatus Pacebacteria bacterium]|nr:aminoacyl-tRNA hydrolase [Candidatus Paceibacterota bacterium]MDD4830964.1 aminoacyl-tRNA hydrolase [Candidatus Paceibacterota bacterium]MDD4875387.1 aminoacyl-tRNA hydrolase [Candidatus Paceibacterota bacterium]